MAEIDDVKREVVLANRMLFEMGLPTVQPSSGATQACGCRDNRIDS